jgi:hypothetical protein
MAVVNMYVPEPIRAINVSEVKSNAEIIVLIAPPDTNAARSAQVVPSPAPADDVEKYRVTTAID